MRLELAAAAVLCLAGAANLEAAEKTPPVPLGSILLAFAQDETTANVRYKGRLTTFSASALSVASDPPALLVKAEGGSLPEGSTVLAVAACILESSSVMAASAVEPGQRVTVRGRLEGLVSSGTRGSALTFSDCTLELGVPGEATEVETKNQGAEGAASPDTSRKGQPGVTKSMFALLAKRMYYEQVVGILGEPSECHGDKDTSMGCYWTNTDGSGILTWFHNRRMSVLHQKNLPD